MTRLNAYVTLTPDVAGSPVRELHGSGSFGWHDLDYTLVSTLTGSVCPGGLGTGR